MLIVMWSFWCRNVVEMLSHTLMPSNLDSALRGLNARRVLRDLMAAKSEYPSEFATRLINDTYMAGTERQAHHEDHEMSSNVNSCS